VRAAGRSSADRGELDTRESEARCKFWRAHFYCLWMASTLRTSVRPRAAHRKVGTDRERVPVSDVFRFRSVSTTLERAQFRNLLLSYDIKP
jgi:hypothetical protein